VEDRWRFGGGSVEASAVLEWRNGGGSAAAPALEWPRMAPFFDSPLQVAAVALSHSYRPFPQRCASTAQRRIRPQERRQTPGVPPCIPETEPCQIVTSPRQNGMEPRDAVDSVRGHRWQTGEGLPAIPLSLVHGLPAERPTHVRTGARRH
jgi:hypothetical protein